MSGQALGYVFDHSPFRGADFAVHLAIADVVNDLHDHEFYMQARRLADKARVSHDTAVRSLKTLVDRGYLESLGHVERSRTVRYRFLFPSDQIDERSIPISTGDRHGIDERSIPKRTQEERDSERTPLDVDFDAFWNLYPRKVAKGRARKAYRAARKKADADTILAGLRRAAAAFGERPPDKVPYPATWLNDEGWGDEYATPPRSASGGGVWDQEYPPTQS